MSFDNKRQQEIITRISPKEIALEKWKDYRWQLKHSVKTIEAFQKMTGIKFDPEQKKKIKKTLAKFPLSITPYYVSLIDKRGYKNDPIFRQA
ncbi:MAG: lysine 2,3-aminomutase, partial [Candidatus Omnitrophica bacterium]|nr:lysine 2,3-aminomutase [Candidatus Omnitrophota bacterium]